MSARAWIGGAGRLGVLARAGLGLAALLLALGLAASSSIAPARASTVFAAAATPARSAAADGQQARAAPAVTAGAHGDARAPISVLLLRHAEKDVGGGTDPALSDAGKQRAADLARLCARSHATAVYASTFARTRQTVEPLAALLGVEVQARDPKDTAALAAELRELAPGSVVVVAGHSNTVPALAKALGAELSNLRNGMLAENEYDRLFVLSVDPSGACPTGVVELAYGRE